MDSDSDLCSRIVTLLGVCTVYCDSLCMYVYAFINFFMIIFGLIFRVEALFFFCVYKMSINAGAAFCFE